MNELPSDLPPEASTPRWRLWLSAISVLLVPLVVLGVVSLVFPSKSPPAGIQTCVFPDGTRLVLHQVTYGKSHHFRKEWRDWLQRSNPIEFERTTPNEAAVLWFYSEDQAGRPCKFHGRAVVENEFGHRSHAAEFNSVNDGSKTLVMKHVLEVGALRAPSGNFKVLFLNEAGEKIATFDIPSPFPTFETWMPEPLPASKTLADGLEVHLDGFDAEVILRRSYQTERWEFTPMMSLKTNPRMRVTLDGKSVDDWVAGEGSFRAPYGSFQPCQDCLLSPHEPAWEFRCAIHPSEDAQLPKDWVWDLGEFEIPPAGSEATIRQTRTMLEYQVDVISLKTDVSSTSTRAETPQTDREIGVKLSASSKANAPRPLGVAYSLIECRMLDEQGRRYERFVRKPKTGPGIISTGPDDYRTWFQIPTAAKKVRLQVHRNPHYLVKFLVEPPRPSSTREP